MIEGLENENEKDGMGSRSELSYEYGDEIIKDGLNPKPLMDDTENSID
jgi:hypothetical protein